MTFEEYVLRRVGGDSASAIIRNMFIKPFYSSSLRSFWKYWNPSWGYYLLFYCYKPTRYVLPHWASFAITFLICGLLHDLIYLVPMLINENRFAFPFVTVWFLIISVGILFTEVLHFDLKKIIVAFRPIIHLSYLVGTFGLARFINLNI